MESYPPTRPSHHLHSPAVCLTDAVAFRARRCVHLRSLCSRFGVAAAGRVTLRTDLPVLPDPPPHPPLTSSSQQLASVSMNSLGSRLPPLSVRQLGNAEISSSRLLARGASKFFFFSLSLFFCHSWPKLSCLLTGSAVFSDI